MLKYEFGPERTILFSDHFEAHFGHEFGDGGKTMWKIYCVLLASALSSSRNRNGTTRRDVEGFLMQNERNEIKCMAPRTGQRRETSSYCLN